MRYAERSSVRRVVFAMHRFSTEKNSDARQPGRGTQFQYEKLEDKNGKAIAIWESLMERNEAKLRPFAEAMELKETKAYELLTGTSSAGLIEWERRKVKA